MFPEHSAKARGGGVTREGECGSTVQKINMAGEGTVEKRAAQWSHAHPAITFTGQP